MLTPYLFLYDILAKSFFVKRCPLSWHCPSLVSFVVCVVCSGVERNMEEAFKCFERAANDGNMEVRDQRAPFTLRVVRVACFVNLVCLLHLAHLIGLPFFMCLSLTTTTTGNGTLGGVL